MKIEHIAIWCKDLENMRSFYQVYFNARSNQKYTNAEKGFESYFLSFDEGSRLELMKMSTIPDSGVDPYQQVVGLTHLAFTVGTEKDVDLLTDQLEKDGFEVLSGPRRTGDGYYEALILDPEGNRVEITAINDI